MTPKETPAASGSTLQTQLEQDWAPLQKSWLDTRRQAALGQFLELGFPSRKLEAWRFTDTAKLARTPFRLADAAFSQKSVQDAVQHYTLGRDVAAELVFVNGHYQPQWSHTRGLVRGCKVIPLADALSSEQNRLEPVLFARDPEPVNPFVVLNTAFLRDGAYVFLPAGSKIQAPIHLLFLSTGSGQPVASHPRLVVIAEQDVEATLVETYASIHGGEASSIFTNALTQAVIGPHSHIDHCKLQQESSAAFHAATMDVLLGEETTFVSHAAALGARWARNDLNVIMGGPRAEATLNGLVLIDANQHVDNHTLLDHAFPNCPSHELYKHILGGQATGVFQGKILVRSDAQKTDSKQTSKSLLLSDEAQMNSQPALEIYADDVKCTHGSTVGPVDEEMVFYLRSRGISLAAARHLLTYAFAADITRRIRVEPVRRRLEDFMAAQHDLPQDLRITDLGSHDEKAR
jgi:Fe-S cluster assembly protein SufD